MESRASSSSSSLYPSASSYLCVPCAHARCREKAGSAGKIETIAVIAASQRAGPRRRQWYRRVCEIGAAPKRSRRTRLDRRTDGQADGGTRFRIVVRGILVWRIKLGFMRSLCRVRIVVGHALRAIHPMERPSTESRLAGFSYFPPSLLP